ncbi:diguanylate cyclase domain-containing protein [Benzoatithermus flavus]|uniref:Diguanylate cyclase n=1 Tax=Benzoatithermus flavus TaxID=3108223 RepID=A0ABU8XWG7_9PROT
MAMDLAPLLRPSLAGLAQRNPDQDFPVLLLGGPTLRSTVEELLADAGLVTAHLSAVASVEEALQHLAVDRPAIVFLGVAAPGTGCLNALVRLQAAAPGMPVVPLPNLAEREGASPPCGAVGGCLELDREEVVSLLQQLALLDDRSRQLFYLATHDRLTGLANRWLLEERLRQAILRSDRTGVAGALLFIDLDRFKAINDRYGHAIGDRMLVVAAQRLTQSVRASDTVARWGGDEFAVILEGVHQRSIAEAKGWQLMERLAAPTEITGVTGCLRASVGVALFPDEGRDIHTLFAKADRRMYRAKGRGLVATLLRRA